MAGAGQEQPVGFGEECEAGLLPPACRAPGSSREVCWAGGASARGDLLEQTLALQAQIEPAPADAWRAHYCRAGLVFLP